MTKTLVKGNLESALKRFANSLCSAEKDSDLDAPIFLNYYIAILRYINLTQTKISKKYNVLRFRKKSYFWGLKKINKWHQ